MKVARGAIESAVGGSDEVQAFWLYEEGRDPGIWGFGQNPANWTWFKTRTAAFNGSAKLERRRIRPVE